MFRIVSGANKQSDTEFEYSLLPLFLTLYEVASGQKVGWSTDASGDNDNNTRLVVNALVGKLFRAVVRVDCC